MFEIVGFEEFKSKYIDKEDCAGINFMSNNLKYGNMVFLKEIDDSPVYYGLSQILYFKIIGREVIVQDKDFFSYYG
jgi:hypothetical protein